MDLIDIAGTRQQQRLLLIDQCLRRGHPGVTSRHILDYLNKNDLDIGERTFFRDIAKLRELGAPIGTDRIDVAHTGEIESRWFYTDKSWTMSKVPLDQGTLFALLVALPVMKQFLGHPYFAEIQKALEKIADGPNRAICIHPDELVPVSFATEKSDPIDPAVWSEVAGAIMAGKRVLISYRKRYGNESGKVEKRNVAPYRIVNLQGVWYLLGTASEKDASLRQYAISCITSAKRLGQSFVIPSDFDMDKLLAVTFGQFIGSPDDAEEIHLRFTKQAAPRVLARQFSRSEKKTVLPDGGVELTFRASAAGPWPFYHIKSWVLSWGMDVEVLAPQRLKEIVDEEIRMLYRRVGPSS